MWEDFPVAIAVTASRPTDGGTTSGVLSTHASLLTLKKLS
jgi:hypothetical protein